MAATNEFEDGGRCYGCRRKVLRKGYYECRWEVLRVQRGRCYNYSLRCYDCSGRCYECSGRRWRSYECSGRGR